MKKLTKKQEEAIEDIHMGTHLFKKIPSLVDSARNRDVMVSSFWERLELARKKGYLAEFIFCPWCGKKL